MNHGYPNYESILVVPLDGLPQKNWTNPKKVTVVDGHLRKAWPNPQGNPFFSEMLIASSVEHTFLCNRSAHSATRTALVFTAQDRFFCTISDRLGPESSWDLERYPCSHTMGCGILLGGLEPFFPPYIGNNNPD